MQLPSSLLAGIFLLSSFGAASTLTAEDGYELWLRYRPLEPYISPVAPAVPRVTVAAERTPMIDAAVHELETAFGALFGQAGIAAPAVTVSVDPTAAALGAEGFQLGASADGIVVTGHTERGILYGAFALLRHLQTGQDWRTLDETEVPRVQRRILNHWDNLNRTVERGQAGQSIWEWFELPDFVSPRYTDYARACASVGINGTVLTNVNADALILTPYYLERVAAIADALRPYGVRVYLTARFSAPVEIGGLPSADPVEPAVQAWWQAKTEEIYAYVPDFGGFLVKANSEGQPGPQDYGRSHAEGANLLADAVAPHDGIVMWRAFVYDEHVPDDRAKQAFDEFVPLDGEFRDNVMVQIKNGPIDFMPREPFHPLFGAMSETPPMLELQITQEYFGGQVHLAFLAPMYEEVLQADTHVRGAGSTVAKVLDGSLFDYQHTGIAGVANVGSNRNWTGHPMAQANWYAFGRQAWNPDLASAVIAEEWTRMTFSNNPAVVEPIVAMLMASHEAVVDYSMPIGLHHIMEVGHHIGPGPWVDGMRADWTSVYYHRATSEGVGFDRTATGSDALAQYAPEVAAEWGDLERVPENLLLWFHHVPWDYPMASGRPLWDEMALAYQRGVETVRSWRRTWAGLEGRIDAQRHAHVAGLLARQQRDAEEYRDACLLYFQTFSGRPLPEGVDAPARTLQEYIDVDLRFVPGNPSGY